MTVNEMKYLLSVRKATLGSRLYLIRIIPICSGEEGEGGREGGEGVLGCVVVKEEHQGTFISTNVREMQFKRHSP
jgi:hypothetical protein